MKVFNLILISVPILLISCSKGDRTSLNIKPLTASGTVTQINWVGHWRDEGDKGKLVRELANEYEFLNQNLKVNLVFPEDLYGMGKADIDFIVSQIKTPKPDWDIIRLFGYFPEIANKLNDPDWADKYLVDFSKIPGFMESHNPFITNKVYQRRFNNKFFGPYSECQLAALYVNTEVAKKMGIKVKQFDMTFDDFVGYIKAAYQYNMNHKPITPIFEYDWNKTVTIYKILFFSILDNYDEAIDANLTPKKLMAIKKCFEAMELLSKFEPIQKNWRQHKWQSENGSILYDSCLFFPNYTFMYNIWKQNGKDSLYKIVPCEFPVFKPSKVYIGGYNSNWAVLKNSPHKEEAIKLLMYWCKPDVANKWVRYTKSPSGVKGFITSSSFGADPFENYSYMMDKKYEGNLLKEEDMEYFIGSKNKNIILKVTDVLEGSMTAVEAYNDFIKRATF